MEGLRTLKARILLLVLFVLLAVGAALIVLSRQEIETALYRREEDASKDLLFLVARNIESQYLDLLYHYRALLQMRKVGMKDLAGVALQIAEDHHLRFQRGAMSQAAAQRAALDQIRALRYGSDDYFFVYDSRFVAIAHPDRVFEGKMLRDYEDLDGKAVIQELMTAARQPGGGFVEYRWKRLKDREPVRKVGYAVFYPKWQWMIGTGLYIDDLDAEYHKKLDAMVAQLKSSFARITAESGGSFFLFNGKKELLVPPGDAPVGTSHLDALVKAAATPGRPFRYVAAAARGEKEAGMQAYAAYFPPLDWYIAGAFNEAALKAPGRRLLRRAALFLLMALLASLALGYWIAARIARPIGELAGYAKDLASRDFRPAPDSIADRLSTRGDEVGKLAEAFSSMQRTLQTYLRHLTETTAARERIESELRIARELQMSLLPRGLAEAPGMSRFAIYGCLDPSREVGGDFYDYFFNGDGRLCLVIGDVSGKGLPASLFMAVSKTLIRATALLAGSLNSGSPDAVLARVNAELQRDNEQRMFATVFFAIVDLATGEMEYSNAGHNPPFVLSARGSARPLDDLRARPLGIKKNAGYSKSVVRLAPGDILFLYTDGIPEMENPDGRAFGEAGLRDCLENHREESPESLTGRVLAEVNGFRGGNAQRDDVTAMALRYDGPATEARPERLIGTAG